jgi:plastocyanin
MVMKKLALLLFLVPMMAAGATHLVDVGPGMQFSPATLNTQTGDTVTWRFNEANHTTTSDATTGSEVWNSGLVAPGGTFSHTFSSAGSHEYYCAVHSSPAGTLMNGVVNVAAPPPAGPTITSITPNAASASDIGDPATIVGTNFDSSCSVTFGTQPAPTTFVSSTTLHTMIPAPTTIPQVVSIFVTCNSGTGSLPNSFHYITVIPPLAQVPALSPLLLLALAAVLAITGWVHRM